MMTISVLVIRASNRELSQANASVARERALMAAQATVEFGAAQLRQEINQTNNAQQVINAALGGFNTPGDPSACMSIYDDCIPGGNGQPNISQSGQKNRAVTGKSDCSGRPCMRQGAIALLPDRQGVPANWVQIPLRDLLDGADAEARVTLWVRNNNGDAVNSDGAGSWLADSDGRVVLTAMATIRNTTVTVAQEYALTPGTSAQAWSMNTPDVGDGGGHNGDNVMAAVCIENFAGYEE